MMLHDLRRVVRTVRHLRASQLLWRGRYVLERRLLSRRFLHSKATDREAIVDGETFPRIPVLHRLGPGGSDLVRLLAEGDFRHLNRTQHVGRETPDWQLGPRSEHRLWTISLHYHHWLYELAEAVRGGGENGRLAERLLIGYVTDWIERCGLSVPGARHLAWNSFAIATRMSCWIRSYFALGQAWWDARPEFRASFLGSMWQQAEYLSKHFEWDLRANHLLRDAVGLAWAARFFTGRESDRWLAKATAVGIDQAREQVLDDGGHFERSPMYHLHVMEDILSLALLLEAEDVREELRRTWVRMAEYLAWMRHPDGEIPLFNDGALNAACCPTDMLACDELVGTQIDAGRRLGGQLFRQTGMAVWHGQPWSLFFDVGEVGPDCQPGHAHADTLSIECSFQGERLFVDPGTYGYDRDHRRDEDRSTAAHNTVCIDETNSSEVWDIFRVGARARPQFVEARIAAKSMTVTASHNGYSRLPGAPRHTRQVSVADCGGLEVVDRVEGRARHRIEGGFLLAPGWTAVEYRSGWMLSKQTHRVRVSIKGPADVQLGLEPKLAHPEFGTELETTRLTWRWAGELPLEVSMTAEPCLTAHNTNDGKYVHRQERHQKMETQS